MDRPGGPRKRPRHARRGPASAGDRARDRVGSPLTLVSRGGREHELVHPPCVEERRPDYEEALEIWRMGEPEEARDALRYALDGCGANLWVHAALGRIALEAMRDRALARGHFGYAVELVEKALP